MNKALIIDIAAKQDFVYRSNKLRHNLGASFILADIIFGTQAKEFKDGLIYKNLDITTGKIVNIGGGNAILYFKEIEDIKTFMKKFSTQVKVDYPDVVLEAGTCDVGSESGFNEIKSKLIADKEKRRSQKVSLYNTDFGLAQKCRYSGLPVNSKIFRKDGDKTISEPVNVTVASKYNASFNAEEVTQKLKPLKAGMVYSSKIEEIVPEETKAFVAVVHIDGNKLGDKFIHLKTEDEFKTASETLDRDFNNALNHILIKLQEKIIDGEFADGSIKFKLKKISEKETVLPFRSIINAGDDVTFVCHGKIAIWLSELYLTYLESKGYTAAAGIAIVHKNHPFYRTYTVAEELCKEAKNAHQNARDENRINFIVLKEGISDHLNKILAQSYTAQDMVFKNLSYNLADFDILKKLYADFSILNSALRNNIIKNLHQPNMVLEKMILESCNKLAKDKPDHEEKLRVLKDIYQNIQKDLSFKEKLSDAAELLSFYPIQHS